jgi:hypothetical protein
LSEHEHRYVFLRQEPRTTQQWGDRVHERVIEDVYFCESCLGYQRVRVRREIPNPRELSGWVEVPGD